MGNDEMSDAIEILQKVISRKNYTPLSLQEFEELAMVHNVLAKAVDVEGLLEGVIQILNHARCIVNKPPVGNRELANRIIKHLAAQGYIGGAVDTSWIDGDLQNEICGIITEYGVEDIYTATDEILLAVQNKAAPKKDD